MLFEYNESMIRLGELEGIPVKLGYEPHLDQRLEVLSVDEFGVGWL